MLSMSVTFTQRKISVVLSLPTHEVRTSLVFGLQWLLKMQYTTHHALVGSKGLKQCIRVTKALIYAHPEHANVTLSINALMN